MANPSFSPSSGVPAFGVWPWPHLTAQLSLPHPPPGVVIKRLWSFCCKEQKGKKKSKKRQKTQTEEEKKKKKRQKKKRKRKKPHTQKRFKKKRKKDINWHQLTFCTFCRIELLVVLTYCYVNYLSLLPCKDICVYFCSFIQFAVV